MSDPHLPDMTVTPGTAMGLAVDSKGVPDGTEVSFEISTGTDVIATLKGQIKQNAAVTRWIVDVGKRPLPLDATFTASAQGKELTSFVLHVKSRAEIGAIAWTKRGAAPTDLSLPMLDTGDEVTLHVAVSSDEPVDVEMAWETFDPEHPERPGQPLAAAPPLGTQTGISGHPRDVTADWTAAPLSDQPIRVAVRLLRGGIQVARAASAGVLVHDRLDVTFQELDWVAAPARETTPREWLERDPATGTWGPAKNGGAWQAWQLARGTLVDDADLLYAISDVDTSGKSTVRVKAGTQQKLRVAALRMLVGPALHRYVTIGGGAATFGQPQEAKIITRCRSSIWADPNYFMVSKDKPTFTDRRLSTFPKAGGLLDDITILNSIDLKLEADGTLSVKLALKEDFVKSVIKACHARSIQVLADLTAIERFKTEERAGKRVETDEPGDAGGRRFMELVRNRKKPGAPSFLNQKTADIAGAAKQFVDLALRLGFDGIEMDVEDGLTGTWPADATENFRRLMAEIAGGLAPTNRFLGIANGGLVAPGRMGTGPSTDIPAQGSAGAQPFELAHEGSNIIMRPMGYDNGIGKVKFKEDPPVANRDKTLRGLHERIIQYALKPRSQNGAGLHPGQFQLGVKMFVPYGKPDASGKHPETGQGGEIRGGGAELATTCREVLRPHRVGVIQFAHGSGSDETFTVNVNFIPVNQSLNFVGPDRDPPTGKDAVVETLPGAAVGQPMQCPLNSVAVSRMKEA